MCVAAVIFEKVSYKYLQHMEDDNPHGAGVAWEQDGAIHFLKGLTAKEIYDLQEAGVMSYPYLMHYRWATHGDRVPELTHPFPLGPRALLGETSGSADRVLIHNGTWSYYDGIVERFMNDGNYELPEELIQCASDTALAAWLAEYDESILDSVMWATALAEMRETTDAEGNLKRTMDITTRGQWYDKDGNWYSNLNWVPGESSAYNFRNWRNWGSTGNWSTSCEDSAGESSYTYTPPSHSAYDEDGWEHYQGVEEHFDAVGRAVDKKYVGKHSDIVVDLKFYDTWTSKKDDFKPDLVDWHDWYTRFWGPAIKDIRIDGKITSEQTPSKEAAREGAGLGHFRDTIYSEKVNSSPDGLVDPRQSWNDYLVTKYGAKVAREIHGVFFDQADDPESEGCGEGESDPDAAMVLDGWDRSPADPDWLHDGDVISEDPTEVNEWLARQMLPDLEAA